MKNITKIRIVLGMFVLLLVLSGVTAFPVRTEIDFLVRHLGTFPMFMQTWILQLKNVIDSTPDIILYGTDWLAFAHIIIAMFFVPVFVNPVKHKTNIVIGMVACVAVFPLAFICGPVRGIPFFHQLIDCAFGVGGILLLFYVHRKIAVLEKRYLTA